MIKDQSNKSVDCQIGSKLQFDKPTGPYIDLGHLEDVFFLFSPPLPFPTCARDYMVTSHAVFTRVNPGQRLAKVLVQQVLLPLDRVGEPGHLEGVD